MFTLHGVCINKCIPKLTNSGSDLPKIVVGNFSKINISTGRDGSKNFPGFLT